GNLIAWFGPVRPRIAGVKRPGRTTRPSRRELASRAHRHSYPSSPKGGNAAPIRSSCTYGRNSRPSRKTTSLARGGASPTRLRGRCRPVRACGEEAVRASVRSISGGCYDYRVSLPGYYRIRGVTTAFFRSSLQSIERLCERGLRGYNDLW